jgi:hypothetical protein
VQIRLGEVLINLVLAAVLSSILRWIYIRYGTSLSNRNMFAQNFLLLACTTTLVITVVKSSLALSLGLVGALSIVRFRAAIKEPEELAYLFLCIAIGLGFGASQTVLTITAFGIIVGLIVLRSFRRKPHRFHSLYLTLTCTGPSAPPLSQVASALTAGCRSADLQRFDERPGALEASFLVGLEGFQQLDGIRRDLRNLDESMQISFIDNRGVE